MTDKNYLNVILNEINNNDRITQKELAVKYNCHERTIRRYFKKLKDNNVIKISGNGRDKKWEIVK